MKEKEETIIMRLNKFLKNLQEEDGVPSKPGATGTFGGGMAGATGSVSSWNVIGKKKKKKKSITFGRGPDEK